MGHSVQVVPVHSRREREDFIHLPDRLNRGDPAWVPPLLLQRREDLHPEHNPYFAHAEVRLFLALRDGRPVGRISAQVDRLAVHAHGPIGHFGLLAAEDGDVVGALAGAAEGFLRQRGMRAVRGPFNLSINQECGLLVHGHEVAPTLMTPHDAPHLGPALAAAGYAKIKDLLAYGMPVEMPPPTFVRRLLDGMPSDRLRVRPLDSARLDEEIGRALAVFNDAWAGNWGFVRFTADEMTALAQALKLILVDDLVWFAELDGEPAGMLIALPDVNEAIRDLGGRLFPLGWAKLLWRLKVRGVAGARVPLMGVRRGLRGAMAAAIPFALIEAVRPRLAARGFRRVEMSWVLEDNLPMRRLAETLGGQLVKTWRLYERTLP